MKRKTAVRSVKRATGKRSRGAANVVTRNEMMARSAALAPANARSREQERALANLFFRDLVAADDEARKAVETAFTSSDSATISLARRRIFACREAMDDFRTTFWALDESDVVAQADLREARWNEWEQRLARQELDGLLKRVNPLEEMFRQQEKLMGSVLGATSQLREADRTIRALDGMLDRFQSLEALRVTMTGNLQDVVPQIPAGVQETLDRLAPVAELMKSWEPTIATLEHAASLSKLAEICVPQSPIEQAVGTLRAARASATAFRVAADPSDVIATQLGAASAAVRAMTIGKEVAQRFRKPKQQR